MRKGRPSQTAALVALIRALSDRGLTNVPGFSDPFAHRLLSLPWRVSLAVTERSLGKADPAIRARLVSEHDMVPLRVRAIDEEIELAVKAGVKQVVILGAGLDTRAFRMACLGEARVFEVDHPSTQAYKRRKAGEFAITARSHAYVTVDFERDSLETRLFETGFRESEPTIWIWEGVVMYLTDDALRATLRTIGKLSAPESVLVVNYHEPDASRAARGRSLALKLIWNEPLIGLRTRAAMAAELERAGFEVLRDTTTADWAAKYRAPNPDSDVARVARIVVARPILERAGSR